MEALVLTEYNHFEVQEVPKPEPEPGEVLVAVRACGICGSDIHGMDGSSGRRQPPIIMGHEAAGVVTELGSDVRDFVIGDRVTFDSMISCGECDFCRVGRVNLCDRRRVFGVSCDEYRRDGAFAQYVAVPERIVYRLPEDVSFEHAAMVEPLSVAVHAVNLAKVSADDTVVLIGAGMIGLLVVQVLRSVGCRKIIAVDLDEKRLATARTLGAHETLRGEPAGVREAVLEQTDGRGGDVVIEAVGISPTVQMAVACVCSGGRITLIGNLAPEVELPLQSIVTREVTLYGSCASSGEYAACLEMLANGDINPDAMISATAPLAEGPVWFDRLKNNNDGLLKVILQP